MALDSAPSWLGPLIPRRDSSDDYRELFDLFLSTDWGAKDSSLADFAKWPYSLKTLVQLMFTTDVPQCLLWGKNLLCIYNVAYWRHVAVSKHPELMGMTSSDANVRLVGKSWDPTSKIMQVIETGRQVVVPETLVLRESKGGNRAEEIYTSYCLSPIYDDDSQPAGIFSVHSDLTGKVLVMRKSLMLRSLLLATQDLTTLLALRGKLQSTLDNCGLDFPMCSILLAPQVVSEGAQRQCLTEELITYETFVSAGMRTFTRTVDYNSRETEQCPKIGPVFAHLARKCHKVRGPIIFKSSHITNSCTQRAFGRVCEIARLSPMYAVGADKHDDVKPFGYLLLSFSPVRPVDDYIKDYANTVDNLITNAFQTFHEVTSSKFRQGELEAVRKTGEKFFRVLNNSPVGISLRDWKAHQTLFANRRWKTILGLQDNQSLDTWLDLVLPEDVHIIRDLLSRINPGDIPKEINIRLKRLHTNQKPVWLAINCSFHQDILEDQQLITFLSTAIFDISEQIYAKELELAALLETDRLRTARKIEAERADEADRAKARQLDYIDTLAHEIRNPISAIVQTVDILSEKLDALQIGDKSQADLVQEGMDDLATIDICTTHMSRVINDALSVSKLEHGSLSISIQHCDLLTHIQSIYRMLKSDMTSKNITCCGIEVDRRSARSFRCALTDPMRYKQIVLNLMTNAIKFTAQESGAKEITIKLSAMSDPQDSSRQVLKCSVCDTGRGMSADAIEKLYGKFYQEPTRSHVNYGTGTGLGLFISQRLAALLNGKIEVVSTLGSGSEFTFSVSVESIKPGDSCPLDKDVSQEKEIRAKGHRVSMEVSSDEHDHSVASPLSDRSERRISAQLSNASIKTPTNDIAPTKSSQLRDGSTDPGSQNASVTILVVEDNLINQRLMVKQLKTSGYHVLVGNHGLEALDHFKQGTHVDLVITDIEMPHMDGIQTIAAVRALEDTIVQPPFIACSAYARQEQTRAFLDAGMTCVIAKPHKYAELKNKVEDVLRTHGKSLFRRETTV